MFFQRASQAVQLQPINIMIYKTDLFCYQTQGQQQPTWFLFFTFTYFYKMSTSCWLHSNEVHLYSFVNMFLDSKYGVSTIYDLYRIF